MSKSKKDRITDRKKADEALFYQANLLSQVHEAVLGLDGEENILYWNKGAEEIFGYTAQEVVGKNSTELLQTKIIAKSTQDKIANLVSTGSWEGQASQRRKDGVFILTEVRAATIKDAEDKISGIVAAIIDITERKQAEEALKESENRFRLITENIPDPIYLKDRFSRMIMANPACEQALGKTIEKMRGKNDLEINANPEIGRAILENDKRIMDLGKTEVVEENIDTPNGRRIYSSTKTPWRDSSGKVIGLIGISRDITERKKAEEALRESEQRYYNLFSGMDEGFFLGEPIVDENNNLVDYRFLEANSSFEKQSGLKVKDVLGKRVKQVLPHIEPFWIQTYGQVALTGQSIRFENYNQDTNRYYEVYSFSPAKWQFAALFTDITERKETEEALKKSKEQTEFDRKRLENILEIMPSAVVILDAPDGKFSYANKRAVQLYGFDTLGLDLAENVAKVKAKRVDGTDYPIEQMPVSLSLKLGTEVHNEEMLIERPDGKTFPIIASTAPLLDIQGNITAAIVVFEDITERKKAEESLKEAQAKLQDYAKNLEVLVEERTKKLQDAERLAAIGATAGMVGHDIRNPLQAMISDIYLIRDELSSSSECKTKEGIVESIDSIEKNVCYVNKIVADLQDYSRVLKPEMTDIADLCPVVKGILDSVNIPSNISVLLTCSVKSHSVRLELTYLKRILTNLVTNAVQAMPNGGRLTIDNFERDGKLLITVEDTGAGIPEEVKPQLFKPLMTTKAKGQGLGLAVVKRLVEAQNGTITFESEEGKGTKFIIELPLIH